MVTMENSDEILQILERFTRLKQKEIPKELEDYLQYVAKTGETIFKWSSIKYLFREKLLSVIKHFNEDSPRLEEIPNYPNVDPFNYETMKSSLLERLDLFTAAPFTVQRLCELLIDPRKQYSRIDKFMRALEKNILGKLFHFLILILTFPSIETNRRCSSFYTVVSTIDPGRKRTESENGDSLDSVVNGDLSLEVNIDIEMENEALINNGNAEEGSGSGSGSASGTSSGGGAVKSSCPRSDDNDLPKAKKAKLEIEGDDLPEADQEADSEVASKTKKEEVKIDSDETDAPREAAEIEEPDEELDESKTAKQALNGSKQKEGEVSDTPASEAAEDSPVAQSPEAVSEPLAAAKEKAEEVKEKEAAAGEPQEKIVEKQETEKAEKADKPVEQSAEKPAAEETPEAKEDAEKDAKVPEVEKEKAEEMITPPTTEEKDEKEKADAEAKPASADKAADEQAAARAESKPETKAEDKPEPEVKESQNPEKTETASAKKPSPPPEEKVKDTQEADEPADKAEKKEDDKTAKAAEAGKEPMVESEREDSSLVAEELAAATTPQSPVSAAAESAETPPAEAVDDADGDADADADADSPVAAVTPPALALNDQPMEDTPVEEEAARVSLSAAVEEVVMAESGPAPAAEMATDEADKEVAMEVDDTSQEVMIQ
ncbi:hypothetical protein KR054_011726 [Drosophila jambulina]|nr:hypothetical protein KR054_011726 [Drosophila jambulina]